jgi:acyl-CoA reductase-like NAD-dependent aldehyde dehydrogenase
LSPKSFWILASVFHEAGLPAGCLNTIYHAAGQNAVEITKYLIASPIIKKINFTGSDTVGSIISSLAGKYLKPVVVELGGKASAIVCDDADIENAALQGALGAFMYGGQICMSTERIIVHKRVMTRFTAAFDRVIDGIFGDQGEKQCPISDALLTKNALLINDAIRKGAKIVKGDLQMFDTGSMRPLVLADVNPTMDVYYTESFGPSVSLLTAESDEEAIRLANDTEYGLTAAVFTENLQRGLRIARQIESGAVHINNMTVFEDGALPAGGVKQSGFGRFNTSIGLEEWVRTKTVTWAN